MKTPTITRHQPPYPPDIHVTEHGDPLCADRAAQWHCTRATGHGGPHAASGLSRKIYAEWTYE